MKKILLWVVIIVALLMAGLYALNAYIYNEKQGDGLATDFREVTFTVSGEPVTLVDGEAQARTALGGDELTTVRYFGNELAHDVDGDGREDVVFLITQETTAGNEYFYAVAALQRDAGYVGSQAVLIGDRIAPQTTEAGEGRIIIVNYADRQPGEPMTAQPSVGKSLYLLLDPETLAFGEVVQDFEGEER